MKKAVITTGGKQYIVTKGDVIGVELLKDDRTVSFKPLIIYEDGKPTIGTPVVEGAKVTAKIIDKELKADKVTAIRFKAKKRVHKTKGHRQKFTRVEITGITSK
jgi:large subunit ribosomal protein L21